MKAQLYSFLDGPFARSLDLHRDALRGMPSITMLSAWLLAGPEVRQRRAESCMYVCTMAKGQATDKSLAIHPGSGSSRMGNRGFRRFSVEELCLPNRAVFYARYYICRPAGPVGAWQRCAISLTDR